MFMYSCIFCNIIDKKIKADILFEDEACLAFTPIDPIAMGHVLIIPKTHFRDIFDIENEAFAALTIVAKKIAFDIVKKYQATGVNLLHASGKDAQQSVFHFHLHLVPRYPDDGLDLWLRNSL